MIWRAVHCYGKTFSSLRLNCLKEFLLEFTLEDLLDFLHHDVVEGKLLVVLGLFRELDYLLNIPTSFLPDPGPDSEAPVLVAIGTTEEIFLLVREKPGYRPPL